MNIVIAVVVNVSWVFKILQSFNQKNVKVNVER